MQFFIFATAVAGFYFLERRPVLAGVWFALGISLKLLPAIFVPYLLVRGHRRAMASVIIFVVVLSLLPALYFGFAENTRLLTTWLSLGIAEPGAVNWGINPDHSLRGVITRYFSAVPYAAMPDSNYRNINFAQLSPQVLRVVWLLLAGGAYAALLVLAWRLNRRETEVTRQGKHTAPLEYALLFCASLLLAPLTQRIYLVALLFPGFVMAYELQKLPKTTPEGRTIWGLAIAAILCFAVPPLIPGRVNQRLLAVYSPDFWGMLLLSVCLMVILRARLRAFSSAEAAA
jgi:hypothetical protein